jgi:4-amino-4-deoxy-L-arabinose transferase-like glycosyltransferase
MPKSVLARSGLLIAVVVNLVMAAMCVLSAGGQTQTVTVDVKGDSAQVRVDGSQVLPNRAAAPGQYMPVEMPEAGRVSLEVSPSVPSLPDPQGIDSIVVSDSTGMVLLQDNFDSLDLSRWQITAGSFEIDDGVLVASNQVGANTIELLDAGWRDYTLQVRFRNGGSEQLGVRRTDSGGLFYHVFLYAPTTWAPSFVASYRADGTPTGMAWGSNLNLDERGSVTSMVAMVVGSYPLLLLALAGGALVAAALALMEQRLCRAFPGLAQQVQSRTLRPSATKAAWAFGVLAVALAAFGITAYIMWHYYDRVPHFVDEVGYIFQAKLFAAGRLTTAIPSVSEAFHVWGPYNWVYERDGHWSTFYMLGQPLALAFGVALGAMWLVPPLLGGACVVLIGLIGRRLYDPATGLVASVLLAGSPFFLMQSSNFLSHITWVFYMLMSMFLMLRRERTLLFGALAGLFFGLAVNTRPLEAVLVIAPFAIVLALPLLRQESRVEAAGRCLGFVACGAAVGLLMLIYSAATTGDPLRPAYFDYPPGGSSLGFIDGHTLSIGLHNLQARLMALILLLNGWPASVGLVLLLVPFMLGSRNAWDYFCLVCAFLVTSVYVFYPGAGFYEGPRNWFQAVPFLMLLSARGAVLAAGLLGAAASTLRAHLTGDLRPARWAGVAVVAPLLLLLIADGTGGWLFGWNKAWLESNVPQVQNDITGLHDIGGYDNRLVQRAHEMGLDNALVLLQPCGKYEVAAPRAIFGCYGTVFVENSVDFNGDVVWAMYDPDRNERLIAAYPGRDVYVATWDPVSIVAFQPEQPLASEMQ